MEKTKSQATAKVAGWNFDNSYARLPELFYESFKPVPVKAPRMALFNPALTAELGLDPKALEGAEGAAIFAGNDLPEGAQPLAQAYAGHQFGHFTMLGDGRAILLGEQLTPDGQRFDIQLKGSGQTPFSRRGDGRAPLGPMLREYIMSEALHALGIPTTRSLAVAYTGELTYRDTALPGAVLVRVAASHIRVGTFEYAAGRRDLDALRALADYTLNRHFPEGAHADAPYLALLHAVMEGQAALVAKWMAVGFIHGVMNTDNMALSGETIDYGPCAFMDTYRAGQVFSSIDTQGRYAYRNQPKIAHWNLVRFAETLIPLLHEEQEEAIAIARAALETFPDTYQHYWLSAMRPKLGLSTAAEGDTELIEELLNWMEQQGADFTNTFRALSEAVLPEEDLFADARFQQWHSRWLARLEEEGTSLKAAHALMRSHNPVLIPRNHRVEAALSAAVQSDDFQPLHRLLAALSKPYSERSEYSDYCEPPAPEERVFQTFCGT